MIHPQEEEPPTPALRGPMITLKPETFRIVGYLGFMVMVGASVVITKTSIPFVENTTALFTTFGYNNLCIMWDFSPAREVAALISPLSEYSMAAYIVLIHIKVRNAHHDGRASQRHLTASSVLTVLNLVLLAWFRMVFVVSPDFSVGGHTAGFLCLQVALCSIATENVAYHTYVSPVVPLEKQLGRKCALTLGASYVGTFILVTLLKMFLTVYALASSPLSAALGQAVDSAWMVLAVVVPFYVAIITRHVEEKIALGTHTYEQKRIEKEVERRMSTMLPRINGEKVAPLLRSEQVLDPTM